MTRIPFSFLPIPEEVMSDLSLSWGAKYLFGILAKTNWEEVKWSQRKLAHRMKVKEEEVRLRVKELENKQLLIVERESGMITTYRINLTLVTGLQNDPPVNGGVPVTLQGTPPFTLQGTTTLYIKDIIKDIYTSFKEKIHSGARLTEQGEEKIKARLKTYSPSELLEAIDRFSKNQWRMQHNADKGIVWFFRSDEQIGIFLLLQPERRPKVYDFTKK